MTGKPVRITFFCLALSISLTAPEIMLAQTTAISLPENAHVKSYGTGWECDIGYREADGRCAAIVAPANSHLTTRSYGPGWECERGYQKIGETCRTVAVPRNAYLNHYGDRWECDHGYRKVDEDCVEIKVPANGYLSHSSYGSGWECDRGYQEVTTLALP
jgi:hypothetical protein